MRLLFSGNSQKATPAPLVAIGVVISAFVFGTYDFELAVATFAFLVIALATMANVDKKYVPLSWQFGIPAFYLLMFLIFPLLSRITDETVQVADLDGDVVQVMVVLATGLVTFWLGSKFYIHVTPNFAPVILTDRQELEILKKSWALGALIVLGGLSTIWSYFFGYYGLLVISAHDLSQSAGVAATLAFFLMIAHVVAWTRFLETKKRIFFALGIVSTVIMFTSGLISNSKTLLMLPFFLTGISVWGMRGKFPLGLTVGMLLIYVFFAYPIVTALRGGVLASYDDSTRTELAGQMWEYMSGGEWTTSTSETSATQSLGRGLLPYFTQIINQAGENVPYFFGETYVRGLEVLIPRFMYPEKPDMNIGNWTAQAFGALLPFDTVTNLSPTYIGEFYMNFGIIGVIVGMFIVGASAVIVDRHVIGSRRSWALPIMIFAILWQESVIGHTLLPFLKNIALLIPILFLFNSISSLRNRRSIPPFVQPAPIAKS